jgi:hypothetical protein
MSKTKIKPPRSLKGRLKAVGKNHNLGSLDQVVDHFVIRGLKHYGVDIESEDIGEGMERIVDDQGYSGRDELVEHLLLRGLHAYEQAEQDPAKLEERLRGLGYID